MIENALVKNKDITNLKYIKCDITNELDINKLYQYKINKIVCNMAIMDICDIIPLFEFAKNILKRNDIFVFSIVHPCFQTPNMRKTIEIYDYSNCKKNKTGIVTFEYIKSKKHKVKILTNSTKKTYHYHRPLNEIFNLAFENNFYIDGFKEPVFKYDSKNKNFEWYNIPPALIIRLRKK